MLNFLHLVDEQKIKTLLLSVANLIRSEKGGRLFFKAGIRQGIKKAAERLLF